MGGDSRILEVLERIAANTARTADGISGMTPGSGGAQDQAGQMAGQAMNVAQQAFNVFNGGKSKDMTNKIPKGVLAIARG
jgi:hypothetical protein